MKLSYKKMSIEDYQDIADMLLNKKVMKAWEHDFNEKDVHAWIKKQQKRYLENELGYKLITDSENNLVVGQAGITLQEVNGNIVYEIGYIIKYEFWKKGYATKAVSDLLKTAKNKYGLKQVYSLIKYDNLISQKVVLKNDFIKIGEFNKIYNEKEMKHFIFKKDL
ncbi:GNAT family N-acetyltransferase [Spiroplasma endosymbiont of Cantharis lateralis]|uniref:GNAT family N-acetyltransferase n=1 Tax=Spiroplasma endosymbiont of Cantharis lateralis TaxID=3066277 RepID=UPI00313AF307